MRQYNKKKKKICKIKFHIVTPRTIKRICISLLCFTSPMMDLQML